jgi:hypothetical protein
MIMFHKSAVHHTFRTMAKAVPGYVFLLVLCAAAQPVFWESEIAFALESRDIMYLQAGIRQAEFTKMEPGYHSPVVPLAPDTTIPWPYFLKGLANSGDVNLDADASTYFNKAIACADKYPGRMWILAMEFQRCGFREWQEKCIKKLEQLFLASGAQ